MTHCVDLPVRIEGSEKHNPSTFKHIEVTRHVSHWLWHLEIVVAAADENVE